MVDRLKINNFIIFFNWIIIRFIVLFLVLVYTQPMYSQVETVPENHRIYEFLHRMEVKQILSTYHGSVLPLSRSKIAEYITTIQEKRNQLTRAEHELLDLYRLEFAYDLGYGMPQSTQLFSGGRLSERIRDITSHKQKYLYAWSDDRDNSLFVDGLGAIEYRTRSGDQPNNLTLMEIGGRIRGTLGGRVGYYLDGLNGIGIGDR